MRQFRQDVGREHTLFVHVTLIPYIAAAGELKTKPTQHSVRELMEIGIQPDVLICRTDRPLEENLRRKIALFTNVDPAGVIEARDLDSIYEVPLTLHDQKLDDLIVDRLGLDVPEAKLERWAGMVEKIKSPPDGRVRIAVVGKYMSLVDSYKSVQEALIHGGIANDVGVEIAWLSSEEFERGRSAAILSEFDGLLIPGGFGVRGVEGMLEAVRWSRENGLPFFGICLGLQVLVIEYARNVCGLADAHSSEFQRDADQLVICLMDSQRQVTEMGGTMRLGAYPAKLRPGTRAFEAYGTAEISERHRHRYEVNNAYRDVLAENGLRCSGHSPDGTLVEIIELPNHPWFLGCQFHPELKSRPMRAHPLFRAFIAAAKARAGTRPRADRENGRAMPHETLRLEVPASVER
ncbi:MAG: CTP synthase [Gemmatimonadetes bacterium]|nr:CTP synthase [Gemmatimonadota bacterium]